MVLKYLDNTRKTFGKSMSLCGHRKTRAYKCAQNISTKQLEFPASKAVIVISSFSSDYHYFLYYRELSFKVRRVEIKCLNGTIICYRLSQEDRSLWNAFLLFLMNFRMTCICVPRKLENEQVYIEFGVICSRFGERGEMKNIPKAKLKLIDSICFIA